MSNFDYILTGDGMSEVVPRTQSLRGEGPAKQSGLPAISDGGGSSILDFDGIDWSGAAPNWISMIGGVFLPTLAAVALVILFDIAFCWLFARWIGHPWSSAQWMLVAMIMSPLALVSTFICVKLAPKSHRCPLKPR
jgi:hypothetical protein